MLRKREKQKGLDEISSNPLITQQKYWWASRESNTAPTDYESAALTKHELEARELEQSLITFQEALQFI